MVFGLTLRRENTVGNKLKLEDLKVGMYVEIDQLTEIYDTAIIVELSDKDDSGGVIQFIGEPNRKSYNGLGHLYEPGKSIAPIYHDSSEFEEGITYDYW